MFTSAVFASVFQIFVVSVFSVGDGWVGRPCEAEASHHFGSRADKWLAHSIVTLLLQSEKKKFKKKKKTPFANKWPTPQHLLIWGWQVSRAKRPVLYEVWILILQKALWKTDRLCWFHFGRFPMERRVDTSKMPFDPLPTTLLRLFVCPATQLFNTCLPPGKEHPNGINELCVQKILSLEGVIEIAVVSLSTKRLPRPMKSKPCPPRPRKLPKPAGRDGAKLTLWSIACNVFLYQHTIGLYESLNKNNLRPFVAFLPRPALSRPIDFDPRPACNCSAPHIPERKTPPDEPSQHQINASHSKSIAAWSEGGAASLSFSFMWSRRLPVGLFPY